MRLIDTTALLDLVASTDTDLPLDKATIWHIRVLPHRILESITNKADPTMDLKSKRVKLRGGHGTTMREVARHAIAGVTRLLDKNDEPVTLEFEQFGASWGQTVDGVCEEQFGKIPWSEVAHVYEFAMNGGQVDEDDAKNF